MLCVNLQISSSLEDHDYDRERYHLQVTLRNDINYYSK